MYSAIVYKKKGGFGRCSAHSIAFNSFSLFFLFFFFESMKSVNGLKIGLPLIAISISNFFFCIKAHLWRNGCINRTDDYLRECNKASHNGLESWNERLKIESIVEGQ